MMRTLMLGLMWLWAACQPVPVAQECVADSDCGESAICEEGGTCRTVECLTTQDCVFGTYCDDTFTCNTGCGSDLDCLAGETCADNVCTNYGCRDTQLDCALGEYCDDGECKQDPRGHCESCDVLGNANCGGNAECVYYSGPTCQNNNDCDPGYKCDNLGLGKICHLDVCIVECNPNVELDCPRGLSCVQAISGDNAYYCAGDCPYLLSEGAF